MTRSRAQVQQEMQATSLEASTLRASTSSDPDVVKARAALEKASESHRERIKPRLDELHAKMLSLRQELTDFVLCEQAAVHPRVREYFKAASSGLDMGSSKWKQLFAHEYKGHVRAIVTLTGTSFWAGRGNREYGKTRHYAVNIPKGQLNRSGLGAREQCVCAVREGKLLAETKAEWTKWCRGESGFTVPR